MNYYLYIKPLLYLGLLSSVACGASKGTCYSKEADICYELNGEDDVLQCAHEEMDSYTLDPDTSCALLGYLILCNQDTLVEDGTEVYAKNSCE